MPSFDANLIAARYLAAWNAREPVERRAAVARAWTETGSYLDPLMEAEGHGGLDAMIAAAQAQFPGLVFRLAGAPDRHHDRLRFSWTLAPEGGVPVARGTDFAVVAEDGRLAAVTGFLDRESA
ncbi:MAG TPA: nuclear transport factor 2 family protein [Geminicoccus sp.]|uniref:nuclear transport factor 2 family protein n=1 Tax=Geminicoccus sp. TaxID=2024832 RepID=UPI002CE1344A|nr:nuclear transport factor 2 family protein [Geminicoccus sp.]HWL71589.1 nuclear transport factor 2 family protein [Geminicoccus sp.]